MSQTQPAIKPNNHKVHPCTNDKKLALIKDIISKNSDETIIVVTSTDTKIIQDSLDDNTVKVLDDKTLIKDKELSCTLLISFDIPAKAIVYIARLSHTTNKAVLIVNETEQKLLYHIETLLGRVIKQEIISGFEYAVKESDKPKSQKKHKNPRDEEKANQWQKKKRPENKFLGKDENGKAIFSGKSGERNHRHDGSPKERYDRPKKVGRKINIKALDKTE